MPNFVGKMYDDVVNSSSPSYSFQFKKEEKADSDHPVGMILSQTPKANITVKSNADVTLVVSSGGEKVAMPDLTNKSKDEATANLDSLGLKYKISTVADDKISEGNVVSTDPTAGTQVAKGTEVKVYVSSGEVDQKIAVPDVSGDSLSDAESKIIAAGLTVGQKKYQDDSGKAKDVVLSSDPLNGVKVEKGTKVNLTVSSGNASSKPVDVYVDLPKGVSHDIVLRAYVDGSLDKTLTVNPSYNPTTQLTYSDYTGTHSLVITLDNSKYRIYTLDFSTGKPKLENSYEYNSGSSGTNSGGQATGGKTP